MSKRTIEVEELGLGELTPDPENARRHTPRNIGAIVESLQDVGFARSLVIDEDNIIRAGNGTAEAAGEVGMERVLIIDVDGNTPVAIRRSGLTDTQKRKLALRDNRTAELAEWDTEALQRQLGELQATDDLFSLGWNDAELKAILTLRPEAEADGEKEERDGVGGAKLTFSAGQWQILARALDIARTTMPGKSKDAELLVWLAEDWASRQENVSNG